MLWARVYFGVQALGGAAWWIAVFSSPWVRVTTLGSLDPVLVAAFDIPLFVVASGLAAVGLKPAAWVAAVWTLLVALALAGYATVTTEAGCGVLIMAAAAAGSVVALCLVALGRVPTEWITAGPFAFRTARRGPHLLLTVLQMLGFWGLFLVVAPLVIAWLEQRWGLRVEAPTLWLGAVLLVLASALGVWSAITMATVGRGTPLPSAMPASLVVAGPYRWVRNPMAVAGIVQGVAVGLVLSSWLVVAYALIGSLLWNYAVRPLEEADLAARFRAEYGEYRDAVRCWVPRSPRPVTDRGLLADD
jgi:protein-S-isoprenylcysteine O-methyltransferase Ste14